MNHLCKIEKLKFRSGRPISILLPVSLLTRTRTHAFIGFLSFLPNTCGSNLLIYISWLLGCPFIWSWNWNDYFLNQAVMYWIWELHFSSWSSLFLFHAVLIKITASACADSQFRVSHETEVESIFWVSEAWIVKNCTYLDCKSCSRVLQSEIGYSTWALKSFVRIRKIKETGGIQGAVRY